MTPIDSSVSTDAPTAKEVALGVLQRARGVGRLWLFWTGAIVQHLLPMSRLPSAFVPLVAYGLLCTITGVSFAYAFSWSILLGALIGILSGSLPALHALTRVRMDPIRCAELVSLTYVVVIGLVLCGQTLVPLLTDTRSQILWFVPLLLMTSAQYANYLVMNRLRRDAQDTSSLGALTRVFAVPPMIPTLTMAAIIAIYALLLLQYIGLHYANWGYLTAKFLERGIIPPITLMLFFWGLLLLLHKWWLLWREKRRLRAPSAGASTLMTAWHQADVDQGGADAGAFLEIVWKKSVDFYTIPRYINWAIPILGFIGTVLGISLAAEGIQKIIGSQSGVSQLSTDLGQAIAPLGIAFDTTLIALSLSVFLMLLQTVLQRWEDNILIDYEGRLRASAGLQKENHAP